MVREGPSMEGETYIKEFNVYAKLNIFDGTDASWLMRCNSLYEILVVYMPSRIDTTK